MLCVVTTAANWSMRGGQKVLNLSTIAYIFGRDNVTGFSYRLLLVLFKNYRSSVCYLCQRQYIENSWLHCMTYFNKIRYLSCGDKSFWHWRTFSHRRYINEWQLLRWRCAIICHGVMLGCWVSSRQKKPSRWAPVRMSIWSWAADSMSSW